MAGTLGHFISGVASGLQPGFNMGQMKWQQNEKKKLEKKQEEILQSATVFNEMVAKAGEDGFYSDDEKMKINTSYMALGYETKERVDGTYKAIQAMDKQTIEANNKWFDYVTETTKDMKSAEAQVIFDTVRPFISGEKGLQTYAARENIIKKKSEVAKGEKPWERISSLPSEYRVPYLEQEGIDIPEPTPGQPTASDAKLNFAISSYNAGKISFDELSKYMGTYIAPEKISAKREEIELAKQYGATDEEIKKKLLGVTTDVEGTPAPTSTENVRSDILQAPTLSDAQRMYKNYDDKYDVTALGIPDVDKFWSDERVKRLGSLKTSIESLLVDRGDKGRWLKPGTVTSAEIGMEIEGDEQEASIAYRDLRIEYMRFRDMLEKMGVDVSQYPKLKPLSEIEKVGGWEGALGIGVGKGDYKSIYY